MTPLPTRSQLLLLVLAVSSPSAVAAAWSGTLTATTDYVWRGITQSDGHGALQAGIDYSRPSGWFGGVWASTVDIPPAVPGGTRRSIEIDLYAGYRRSLSRSWSLDAGIVHYVYPDAEPSAHYDYTEAAAGLHFRDTLTLAVAYTGDGFGQGIRVVNVDLTLRWPVTDRVTAVGGVGIYGADSPFFDGYDYWSLGATRSVGRIDVDLTWFDTDREAERLFGSRAGGRLVLTVGTVLP